MKTVITHIYNEEYILPWWLNHHKNIFDRGIIIDYSSTDRSVEICRDICPTWKIVTSAHNQFDAFNCDREIELYERDIEDWRICLTATEFIVGNVEKLTSWRGRMQWCMPCVIFAEYNPYKNLDISKPLWKQSANAIPYTTSTAAQLCRSLHNFSDMNYPLGRHFTPHNTTDALIFKFSNCLIGGGMINRRLQIQHTISERDRQSGCSDQHVYSAGGGLTKENLYQYFMEKLSPLGIVNCAKLIEDITK